MKKTLFVGTVLLFGVLISLTVGVEPVAAQGPAGAGAAAVAQDSSHSLHSLNPVTWVKKDSTNSNEAPRSRSDAERKLTPALQAQGVLAAHTTLTVACAPFTALERDASLPFTPATISDWISIASAQTRQACTPMRMCPAARLLMKKLRA